MKKTIIMVLLVSMLMLTACGSSSSDYYAEAEPRSEMTEMSSADSMGFKNAEEDVMYEVYEESGEYEGDAPTPELISEQQTDRIVIRNAYLNAHVANADQAIKALTTYVDNNGGYVLSTSTNSPDSYYYSQHEGMLYAGNIVFRIPAGKLEESFTQIEGLSVEVLSSETSAEDVTSQYYDLDAQLTGLQAVESNLLDLMDKSEEVQDTLDIYYQLTDVQRQINSIQGQLKYYDETSSLSRVSVELFVAATEYFEPENPNWNPKGAFQTATELLRDGFQFLGDAAIILIIGVAPVVLVIGGGIYLIIRILIKVFRRKKV